MIQPLTNAIEAFLVIFNNIPVSIRYFISLSFALFFLVVVVRLLLGR